MPKLVRLYIVSVAIGFAVALAFVAALIALDVARLGHLVLATQGGWLAAVMLVVFNGIVFAGVQFGIAVMGMAERPEPPRGGRLMRLLYARTSPAVPARVTVPARRR